MGNSNEQFIGNLSLMLSSGMDVLSALEVLGDQAEGRSLRKKVKAMHERLSEGAQLWEVLRDSGIFPSYTISLVRTGEEAGMLVENLKIIAKQQEKQRQFRSKIRSAMVYPVFVFSVTIIAGLGVAWFVLPRLAQVFSQLQVELPFITRWLITAGEFVAEYGWWAIPAGIVALVLSIFVVFFFSPTRFIGQWILFHIPGVHGIIVHVEIARFGYLFGTLLSAGIPVDEAIESLEQATDYHIYRKFYKKLRQSIREGYSFREVFTGYAHIDAIIPYTVRNMVATAERSGSLPETLQTVSASYEEKIDSLTKNLSAILEPILLVLVWLVVVGVAIAVILPIYSLVGGLNQSL
ncbi:MAG: type II secretion system F family protein [Candidatus Paceibacterota bacterium]